MQPFAPAPHEDLLQFLVLVTVLLVAARVLAEVASRLRQPPVVGEILAGVILGPSVLSSIPAIERVMIPHTETTGFLLELVGMFGAMFLLVVTGIETDIPLIRRHARTAIGIASGGLMVPMVLGLLVAGVVPDALIGDPSRRGVFALFLATALAVSAIPVVAKILLDLGLIRRTFGQTVLAAGMIDDTIAWILLSIVLGMAAGPEANGWDLALSSGRILLFLGLAATVGRWAVDRLLALVQDRGRSVDRVLTLVIAVALGFGAISHALGIEAILGAFVAGVIFGQNARLSADVVHRLHSMTLAVFSPIFFAIAGLKVDLGLLSDPSLLALGGLILLVAIVGKVGGAYGGARLVGADHWSAVGYGAALNARGAVGIIIASIGLTIGILTAELYAIVALTAIVTSLMAPGLVKWALDKVPINAEEGRRLNSERLAESGGLGKIGRILLPIKARPQLAPVHEFESRLVSLLGEEPSVTLLSVGEAGSNRMEASEFLADVTGLFPNRTVSRRVIQGDPATVILQEAAKAHDLIVLGAPEHSENADVLFNPVVDTVARLAPCPTLIVAGARQPDAEWPPARILVPTNGSLASRRAVDLALTIALSAGASLTVLSVAGEPTYARTGAQSLSRERALARATDIVAEAALLGESLGVHMDTLTPTSAAPEDAILDVAASEHMDLIVIGTGLRPGSPRLFLGPRVETILGESTCPVIVLNSI